jgi:hypothetical protein
MRTPGSKRRSAPFRERKQAERLERCDQSSRRIPNAHLVRLRNCQISAAGNPSHLVCGRYRDAGYERREGVRGQRVMGSPPRARPVRYCRGMVNGPGPAHRLKNRLTAMTVRSEVRRIRHRRGGGAAPPSASVAASGPVVRRGRRRPDSDRGGRQMLGSARLSRGSMARDRARWAASADRGDERQDVLLADHGAYSRAEC